MATNVIMPKLGMTMTEGTIIKWHKKVGDAIEEGMPLFDVETDKLTNTVNANVSGTLLKISVPEDGTADCLAVVAVIGSEGEKLEAEPAPAAAAEPAAPQTESGNDLIVIGGGPGGYVAAIRGAQLGMKVTLIEADAVGGTCLNRGCMPTKALLHSAEVYELATHSAGIGIVANDVSVDWNAVQNARAGVTKKLTDGVKALIKANKITLISGKASFADPKTVSVGCRILTAGKIIIASGSAPIVPPIKGISECGAVIDSTACLQLDHVPESLLVIGGGVIGLELGSVYARFGSKVTVVEMSPKLLPLMDSELTAMVRRQLETKGMEILTESKVVSVESCGAGGRVHIECPNGERTVEAEKILLCVGRKPNIEGLGLEKAGVKTERGYIQVNDRMETSVPGIYAVGDCNGKLMLAHAAMAMGETAAENAAGGSKTFIAAYSPSCAYIGPELAGVGYTEEQLKEKGVDYKVGRFVTAANGRSLVSGHVDGMVKIIAGEKYGEILGVHIMAPSATELIEEAALAIRLEATVDELVDTIHCHPTVSEALREAALAVDGRAIHMPNKKK